MDSPIVIADRFKLIRRLKPHVPSCIHLAEDLTTNTQVILKLEPNTTQSPRLVHEYRLLRRLEGNLGVPAVLWLGGTETHNVLVMELLGPSLQELYRYCERRLSLKAVLLLAEQMISRLELCHNYDYVHRAVKPGHFLIGRNTSAHLVYLIGMETSKRYRDPVTQLHIPYSEGHNTHCEARFASINRLMGIQPSRRDDMESLGYVLLYFLCGGLPWDHSIAQDPRNASQVVLDMKTNTSTETLCRTAPREFALYLNYCRALRFDMQPDYKYLKSLFRTLFERENYIEDYLYDWTVFNYVCSMQNSKRKKDQL